MRSTLQSSFLLLMLFLVNGTVSAETEINCSIPLNVTCDVSNPDGIKSVVVELETGFGPVNVVDETFSCENSVNVSWDPIVPGGNIVVATCNGGVLPLVSGYTNDEKGTLNLLTDGTIEIKPPSSVPPTRTGLTYATRNNFSIISTLVRGYPKDVVQFSRATALAYDQNHEEKDTYYCCEEGTQSGCFSVNMLAQCGKGLDFVACTTSSDGTSTCQSYPN